MVYKLFSSHFKRSQLLRFLVVGAVNTGFSYSIYAGLIFLGLNYAVANLAALLLGILFSFKTQGIIVFRNTDNRLLGRFVLGWAFIYISTITLIGSLMATGLDAYISGALAVPFSTLLSYLTQRHFVFRHSTPTKADITLVKGGP